MLTLLFALAAALAGTCEVTGSYWGAVDVHPQGTSPFTVVIESSKVTARPARTVAGATPLAVRGALRFDATVKELDFHWEAAEPLAHEVLHLGKGSTLRFLAAEQAGEGEAAKTKFTLAFPRTPITVSGVELPCGSLALGIASARAMAETDTAPKWPGADDKKRWKLAPGPVRSAPGAGLSVEIAAADGYTPVVAKFAEKDGWAQVGTTLGPGAWLLGWVEVSRLSAYQGDFLAVKGTSVKTRNGRIRSNEYPGAHLLAIAEGAEVFPAPGAPAWGELAAGTYLVAPANALDYEEVEMSKKQRRQTGKMDWYMVLSVPGLMAEKKEWVKHPDTGKSLARIPYVYVNEDGVAAPAQ